MGLGHTDCSIGWFLVVNESAGRQYPILRPHEGLGVEVRVGDGLRAVDLGLVLARARGVAGVAGGGQRLQGRVAVL